MKTIPISSLKIKPDEVTRFWSHVTKTNDLFGCWLWQGCLNADGYGIFGWRYNNLMAHRFSWVLRHGHIPEQSCVLHRCNTRNCVRPSHLYLGNRYENMLDCLEAGNQRSQKLKISQVKEIKERLREGRESQTKIAADYPVSSTMVSYIANGKRWSHVSGE